jgi:hypothetical protein
MNTFAALTLTTDHALESLLDRKPNKKEDPLFTVDMIKQIIGQSTYLIAVILIFHFLGLQILGFQHVDDTTLQKHQDTVVQTLVFNAFVFAQTWNSFNSRGLDRKLNVFEGIGSSFLSDAASLLNSSLHRCCCPSLDMPCWWSRVPGHAHEWKGMGDLNGSRFRFTPAWRSHPSHPQ